MKTELLAPAGDERSLYAAVASGADAVYIGLGDFNARVKAANFRADNIAQYTRFCHLFGVKVYVTFNTCVKREEYPLLSASAAACVCAGVDAFIVADAGVAALLRGTGVPLHASTQMGLHNLEGARFAERLGFRRIVVARETRLDDIKEIKTKTRLEVEFFVHGALCVSFSGGCLMSAFMNGESGNRGRCNQPCRLEYACANQRGALLSAKDQCLIGRLDELASAGVDSLKIEGRLKSAYYVGETVLQYRRALDGNPDPQALSRLKRAFQRGGFTEGYNFSDNGAIVYPLVPNHLGETIGKVASSRVGEIAFTSSVPLHAGDGVKILADGREVGGFALEAPRLCGNLWRTRCDRVYPAGAPVALTYDAERAALFGRKPTMPVTMKCAIRIGQPPRLTIEGGGARACAVGTEIAQPSAGSPLTKEEIARRLSKLGDTCFRCEGCDVSLDGAVFLSVGALNRLRRDAIARLEEALLSRSEDDADKRVSDNIRTEEAVADLRRQDFRTAEKRALVMVTDAEQLGEYLTAHAELIVSLRDYSAENLQRILNKVDFYNKKSPNKTHVYLELPVIARSEDRKTLRAMLDRNAERLDGICAENIYALRVAQEYGLAAIGGTGLNIYSDAAAQALGCDRYVASVELSLREIGAMRRPPIVFVYGALRLMTLTHCPVKTTAGGDCAHCAWRNGTVYRDRKCAYPIDRVKVGSCYFRLYNPYPMDIRGKTADFSYQMLLNMLNLNREAAERVLRDYLEGTGSAAEGTTRGKLKTGVV